MSHPCKFHSEHTACVLSDSCHCEDRPEVAGAAVTLVALALFTVFIMVVL